MDLLVLYGPPGVGKLTVARELAELTGYKVFHNHLTTDLVSPIFGFGGEVTARLLGRIRLEMIEAAARARLPGLIFTWVYAFGVDDAFVADMYRVVEPLGGRVLPILLTCDEDELMRRVTDRSRAEFGKLRDKTVLKELLETHNMTTPFTDHESLVMDVTHLPARETANHIVHHFGLV
jgi:deoxyadenosine/deoxycytidine kinase